MIADGNDNCSAASPRDRRSTGSMTRASPQQERVKNRRGRSNAAKRRYGGTVVAPLGGGRSGSACRARREENRPGVAHPQTRRATSSASPTARCRSSGCLSRRWRGVALRPPTPPRAAGARSRPPPRPGQRADCWKTVPSQFTPKEKHNKEGWLVSPCQYAAKRTRATDVTMVPRRGRTTRRLRGRDHPGDLRKYTGKYWRDLEDEPP